MNTKTTELERSGNLVLLKKELLGNFNRIEFTTYIVERSGFPLGKPTHVESRARKIFDTEVARQTISPD